MSHEPSSSATSSSPRLAGHEPVSSFSGATVAAESAEDEDFRRQRHDVVHVHKTRFLDHLIRQLDIVIYCQLSILYYLDCSIILLFGRAMNQWFYFTPKPILMNPAVSSNHPNIVAIILLNLASILVHYASTPATANESMRGYSHGGLLIDFVGQKNPVSRMRMIGYDVLILGLQLVMLAVTVEKKSVVKPSDTLGDAARRGEAASQDHDFEERGIRRSEEGTEEIELRALSPPFDGRTGGEDDGERNDLRENRVWMTSEHAGNAFYSGQYIITNVRIIDTIRDHWKEAYTEASRVRSTDIASEIARRRPRFR